ncbi:class I SAM-dependent methyltransferase [Pseudorhodoplanes sinuspersici]|uniref:SAM-dependent methyltransferase n=1 Tax=Pseudorhodoplanes sinuspersici TaxID=1235591 RepID=A0A1W6ZQ37_9HYPH|nr:class I SAM-dependent methyltransferase [Pseudorhodoplanes sinuspersici]ARP99516.1 SAM-dependent methyltransferase [Pseudorhodoplanes sinuspersici]RKE70475.1 methyltransferase family protein [Pseudorhodoplanes sinuspersici]
MLKHETASEVFRATALSAQGSGHSGCRFCGTKLQQVFIDLGLSPLANSYLKQDDLERDEHYFPLRVYVCSECFLVQLEEWESPENIFGDYAYFSSYSTSWLSHAKAYVAGMVTRFGIGPNDKVVEVASNDGYLLQYFVERGIPVLGIEPARNVAEVARTKGIPTRVDFFGEDTARTLREEGMRADLIIGNNVLAHVPDLNDFVSGIKTLLSDKGVVTIEFPHLMRLCAECQIDTIYHEHFSYFSFITAEKIFAAHGLTLFDVEELPTHGGSLRIYAQHSTTGPHRISDRVEDLRTREIDAGFADLGRYLVFEERALQTKRKLLAFLKQAKWAGKRVVGYGAPAKGNTLLNYCGINPELLEYTVDRNPHKQGRFLPGTHIPIYEPERIYATKPDYILILPWNLKDEIINQLSFARSWGAQFVVPIPEPQIVA